MTLVEQYQVWLDERYGINSADDNHVSAMERAAAHVHDEWMKRNPRSEWNKDQHVPYHKLSQSEKDKDRAHVDIALRHLKSGSKNPQTSIASDLHDIWRKGWQKNNGDSPRMKKTSDGSDVNINVPYKNLHPDYQKENAAAAKAALTAVKKHMR